MPLPEDEKQPTPKSDERCPSLQKNAEAESSAPADESKPVPPKYIFKIVKADPKNSFNFEDVADK